MTREKRAKKMEVKTLQNTVDSDGVDLFETPREDYINSLAADCIDMLYNHYFRCRLITPENVPIRKGDTPPPRIFIANHSGMAFPWDAMMLGYALGRLVLEPREDRKIHEMPRSLSAPALSHMPQMAPYFLPGWWKASGCVDATFDNFDQLLQRGSDIIIYPEGVPGIGKGFDKRYRLQRFSTSVVKMAIKHGATICPICVVNGEYINPLAYNVEWLNKVAHALGVPYIPMGPLTPLVFFFPFMFYTGMPAQLNFVFCEEVDVRQWLSEPYRDYEDISEEEFKNLSHQLKKHVQKKLIKGVRKYGKKPYRWFDFLKHALWKGRGKRRGLLPFMWPDLFLTHWHEYHGGKVDKVSRFLRMLPYIAPLLGWIFLLYQNWPRLMQKARTIQFALSKAQKKNREYQ